MPNELSLGKSKFKICNFTKKIHSEPGEPGQAQAQSSKSSKTKGLAKDGAGASAEKAKPVASGLGRCECDSTYVRCGE